MKRILWLKLLCAAGVVCGLLCHMTTVHAGEDNPKKVELKIEKVALFKNGLGFILSSTSLPENAKRVRFGQLPVPSFGTFWIGYPKELKLQSLIASMEEFEENNPVQNIGHLLEANNGRRVILRTGPGEGDVVAGQLLSVSHDPEGSAVPNPYIMDSRRPLDPYGRNSPSPASSNLILIKTDTGTVGLNAGSIVRVDFEGNDPIVSVQTKRRRPSIRMELDRSSSGEKVSISYLTRGITWAPSYLVDLSDPQTAKFSAHALIINELIDFRNVKLDLVTGFPNIKFGEVMSPIAKSQPLADFLNALSGDRTAARGGRAGSLLTQQAVMMNVPSDYDVSSAPAVPNYSTAAEGAVAEDLFFYPVMDLTLMKDETAWIPLFTAEMPYKHIYTWKIGDSLDKEDRYSATAELPERKIAEEVWHSCRLVNSLKMPLTTAATEFVSDGEFAGQDICYYTAPGAETTIHMNRAMNLLADQVEIEIERQRNAVNFRGTEYDLVKVKGELSLRNKLDKAADVEVVKELSGEVLETIPKAKDVQTAKGLKQVNPKHILTWGVEMKSGVEQKLIYQYQVYIRR